MQSSTSNLFIPVANCISSHVIAGPWRSGAPMDSKFFIPSTKCAINLVTSPACWESTSKDLWGPPMTPVHWSSGVASFSLAKNKPEGSVWIWTGWQLSYRIPNSMSASPPATDGTLRFCSSMFSGSAALTSSTAFEMLIKGYGAVMWSTVTPCTTCLQPSALSSKQAHSSLTLTFVSPTPVMTRGPFFVMTDTSSCWGTPSLNTTWEQPLS